MAHWNGQQVVGFAPVKDKRNRGWTWVDCGCCAGIQWGGEEPRECRDCEGNGWLALHEKSRRLALYPGGPFRGVAGASYLRRKGA